MSHKQFPYYSWPVGSPYMQEERRRALRFPLTAAAELVEESSGTRATAYVTDLSLYGCTLRVTHPPRKGVTIRVEIVTGDESFQSRATVAYSHPHSLGLTFQDMKPQSLKVLRKLLVTALEKQQQREDAEE